MSQDIYADQVSAIRDKLARLQEARIENYDELANSITDKYNEKMKNYEGKWKAVSEMGGEELAGMVGAKSIYAGGKKLVDIYKKRQERKTAQKEKEQKDEVDDDDFDEDAEPLDGDVSRAVAGEDNSPVDFFNEDGQKYFTGTEADHEEYYNEDGTLKDPSNIPEGHQVTPQEEGVPDEPQPDAPEAPDVPDVGSVPDVPDRPLAPQDIDVSDVIGGPRTKARAQLERFNEQQDAQQQQDAPQPEPEPAEEPAQPSFEDVVAQGQRERQARLQRGDDVADQSANAEAEAPPEPTGPRASVPEVDTTDPFSENTGARVRPTEIGGEQSGLSDVGSEGSSLLERAGQKAFSSLAQRGQSIRQGFQSVKNFFTGGGGEAGEVGAEAGAEAGGEALAGLGVGDAVLGAIPVVGELALAVSGFVAIGEGIYHLFHPEAKPPAPKPTAPVTAPHALTQKYALALPSVDNAVDRQASVGTF